MKASRVMRLRGEHQHVTIELTRYARSMAAYESRKAMELFNRSKAEPDAENAAVLAMFGHGHARNAFSFAMFALESAELLGWYPTTNTKSDWYFQRTNAAEKVA